MNYKKSIFLFLNLNIFVLFCLITFGYTVDPFYFFHKSIFSRQIFLSHELFMDLGEIDTFLNKSNDYDTILVGTSLTENFHANEITRALESKGTLKLCLSGGHPIELQAIAERALATNKVRHVVWGFDLFTFCKPANTPHQQRVFPYKLYQKDYYKYFLLFNWAYVRQSFKRLLLSFQRYNSKLIFYDDLSNLYYYWDWPSIQKMHKDFISSKKLSEMRENFPNYKDFQSVSMEKFSSVDVHLLPLVEMHPEIQFYFLITPISWTYLGSVQQAQKYFSLQRYLVLKLEKCKNIHIYGFHTCNFIHNLANYYNESHYQPEVNRYMLYSIKHNLHRLTAENIDEYEQRMLENLKTFEIKEHYPHMDSLEDLIQQNAKIGKY